MIISSNLPSHLGEPQKRFRRQVDPIVTRDLADFALPGVVVEVDPDEAEALGAFEETALSDADAWDANADVGEALFDYVSEEKRYGQ
jgi:hypothetical protein